MAAIEEEGYSAEPVPSESSSVPRSASLDPQTREDARRRLLSIKGHVEGILRMLEDETVYCVDALKQIKAVNGALDKVGGLVLRSHLQDHVVTAHQRG